MAEVRTLPVILVIPGMLCDYVQVRSPPERKHSDAVEIRKPPKSDWRASPPT